MSSHFFFLVTQQRRVFVVKFGGAKPTTLEDPMHLLLETASFLVAHGNKTTDEVSYTSVTIESQVSCRK